MKSFKDYVNYRMDRPITEMAVPKINLGGEKIGHRVKTPIQLDQDDVDFLKQFPPEFWAQAINRKYGILLYNAHKAHEKGERIPDTLTVEINGKGGSVLTFTVNNAKVNELYEELSGAEDSTKYSELHPDDLKDDESVQKNYYGGRTQFLGKKLSKYGYDFDDFKIEKDGQFWEGHADAYIVPGKVVCSETIKQWMDHLEEGWFSKEIEGKRGVVNFGTKKSQSKRVGEETGERVLPISGTKTWAPGKDFAVKTRSGSKTSKYKPITSGIPDVRPGYHVDDFVKIKHDQYLEVSKKMARLSSKDIQEYLSLFNKDYLLNPGFSEIDIINQKEVALLSNQLELIIKKHLKNKNKIIHIKKLLEFASYFSDSKNKENFVSFYEAYKNSASGDEDQKHETAIRNAIERTVQEVRKLVEQKRINVIDGAQRFNVHQWNAFRHNKSLGKSTKRLVQIGGVIDNLKQQPAVDYQKVLDVFDGKTDQLNDFWRHISEDLKIQQYCLFGVKQQIGKLEDVSEVTIEEKFIKSLKDAMRENEVSISKNAKRQFRNKIG
jgi:hypothetical protein